MRSWWTTRAKRIFERLRDEHGFTGKITTRPAEPRLAGGHLRRVRYRLGGARQHLPACDAWACSNRSVPMSPHYRDEVREIAWLFGALGGVSLLSIGVAIGVMLLLEASRQRLRRDRRVAALRDLFAIS